MSVAMLHRIKDAILAPIIRINRAHMEKRLRRYGLRYDDCLDTSPEMIEALKLVPQHELDLRAMRLHRAVDLDLKHVELSAEQQALQSPFKPYLSPYIELVKARNAEKLSARVTESVGQISK